MMVLDSFIDFYFDGGEKKIQASWVKDIKDNEIKDAFAYFLLIVNSPWGLIHHLFSQPLLYNIYLDMKLDYI